MITRAQTFRGLSLTLALVLLGGAAYSQTRKRSGSARKSITSKVPSSPASQQTESTSGSPNKVQLKLSDGTRIPVDEAWESQQGIWYKRGGVSYLIPRERVKAIERASTVEPGSEPQVAKSTLPNAKEFTPANQPVWIYLVGGARLETDSADESSAGVWCRRGPLSLFIERSRIDHIEREELKSAADSDSSKERGWSTGSAKIDSLIKQNGAKYGVDPYLVFCVMEQESHFSTRSVSPKGARGLMQLMPGTSARFGVRHPFSPAENISAGTRYLKKLIEQFNGRVDLVLASYNAGEGTVIKYGSKVPPYKETREYVKRISYRYRRAKAPIVRTPNSATSSGRT
jgi:Zn-finger nucleic acid-binding protein